MLKEMQRRCILHATDKSLIFPVIDLFRQNSHEHQNEDMLIWFKALLELLEFESDIELCTLPSCILTKCWNVLMETMLEKPNN